MTKNKNPNNRTPRIHTLNDAIKMFFSEDAQASGTYYLSSASYLKVKKAFRSLVNDRIEQLNDRLKKAEKLVKSNKADLTPTALAGLLTSAGISTQSQLNLLLGEHKHDAQTTLVTDKSHFASATEISSVDAKASWFKAPKLARLKLSQMDDLRPNALSAIFDGSTTTYLTFSDELSAIAISSNKSIKNNIMVGSAIHSLITILNQHQFSTDRRFGGYLVLDSDASNEHRAIASFPTICEPMGKIGQRAVDLQEKLKNLIHEAWSKSPS